MNLEKTSDATQDASALFDDYTKWLCRKTIASIKEEWVCFTTPFLDGHNDCIQIFAKKTDEGCVLTDDGNTCDATGGKAVWDANKVWIDFALKGLGVQRVEKDDGYHLRVTAKSDSSFCLQNLLQAAVIIGNMPMPASESNAPQQEQEKPAVPERAKFSNKVAWLVFFATASFGLFVIGKTILRAFGG